MPNFNFKSQFPIADIVAAAQKKPLLEAQIQQMQEEQKQARLKTLLDALSSTAQASRIVSQNKNDALAQQAAQSQMAGQKDLQSILAEPGQQAALTAPIQHFGPAQPTMGPPAMGPDGTLQLPAPLPPQPTTTSTPTFGQTPQGVSQQPRFNAALAKAAPDATAAQLTAQTFGDPLDKAYKRAQIANIGTDNQLAATKILDERAKNTQTAGFEQQKIDIDKQKLEVERSKLKMDALNNGTKLSDTQANGLLFGERAGEADQQLAKLFNTPGFNPASIQTGAQSKLPNFAQPENVQLLQQSKINFVSAVLRKESGAAISTGEFKYAEKQYFPQPGDTDAVLKQKQENRQTAIKGLLRAGGPQGGAILARFRAGSGAPETPKAPPSAAPAPGSVENGYTFKGGNPADPANWVKS